LCVVESGWNCERKADAPGACSNICGDELVVGDEECDLGSALNSNTGDCTLGCKTATCNDGRQRATTLVVDGAIETDVDCGTGPASDSGCGKCVLNKRCLDDNDCESNFCDTASKRCELPVRTVDSYEILTGSGTTPAQLEIDIAELLQTDDSQNLGVISVSSVGGCGLVTYDSLSRRVTFDYLSGASPCVPPASLVPTPF
jgi:hypothetical protein